MSLAESSNTHCSESDLRQRLMVSYEELSGAHKVVIDLLSLAYMPLGRTKLCDALRSLKVRDASGRSFTTKTVRDIVSHLEKLELLRVDKIGVSCSRWIVELVTREMLDNGRFDELIPIVYKKLSPRNEWGGEIYFDTQEHAIALLRLAMYSHDFEGLEDTLKTIGSSRLTDTFEESPFFTIIANPFDVDWFSSYPPAIQGIWLHYSLQEILNTPGSMEAMWDYARKHYDTFTDDSRVLLKAIDTDRCFIQGRFNDIPTMLEGEEIFQTTLFRARYELLTGNSVEAVTQYEGCLKILKKATGKRKPIFLGIDWAYFILALMSTGDWSRARELVKWSDKEKDFTYAGCCSLLGDVIDCEQGGKPPLLMRYMIDILHATNIFESLFRALVGLWVSPDELSELSPDLEEINQWCVANGNAWLEAETAEILHRLGAAKKYGKRAATLRKEMGVVSICDVVRPKETWERTLSALESVGGSTGAVTKKVNEKKSRLVWYISGIEGYWEFQAKEQKQGKNGRWTKGRTVSMKRLCEERVIMECLTEQDLRACGHIRVQYESNYWGREKHYDVSMEILSALVGHPLVFDADSGERIDVVQGEYEFIVKEGENGIQLSINPPVSDIGDVHAEFVGSGRLIVYTISPEIRTIGEIVMSGVEIPKKGKKDLIKVIGGISSLLTVHSDIGGTIESIPKVKANASPIVQLLPAGEGLIVQLRVQPFSRTGPLFGLGAGGETVIAEVDDVRTQTKRDLEKEKRNAEELIAESSTLTREEEWEGEWHLADPLTCLEFLAELQSIQKPPRILWPKGEKYTVRGTADTNQFRMNIRGAKDWFEVSGELKLDDSLILDMRKLLELTEASTSRFVDLGDGQFIALTHAFRKKLDELRSVGDMHDKGLRVHSLAAPLLDEFAEGAASVRADKKWKEHVKRLADAQACDTTIPTTLCAELRDYQITGYQWLTQLAAWGVGACLADDMGLGKTVQILAVMLHRAKQGPQLVVAPTSVCMNWEEEALRFAPTLKLHRFGIGDRKKTMASIGPFDVVVTSYGLLQNEGALFKDTHWNTIVLDEAQAIKNSTTKRSKAVMALDGDFRILATGTPIENHLGELWNLFRFSNPGLLGSLKDFNERFAIPIEKHQIKEKRNHLKRLIQPFILRRLKGDVLSELPPKTEIVLHVELSKRERAFYEALRQQAVDSLSEPQEVPGQHHMKILAEIMRLRRACCHPKLVQEDTTLPSAKMEVLEAVVDELLENNHKALVFSQFVGHLSLLREVLDKKKISYQYLDGSTPARARKRSVDAFQSGEGDLFLISLKAGGVGLNLTAADYVIHMDPWWNPAVEDQASDRAHRIGQQRPVTVYRIVAKDTIEDKIVALHHQKRDLADSLLEGSDMAGKISSQQLLDLLKKQ